MPSGLRVTSKQNEFQFLVMNDGKPKGANEIVTRSAGSRFNRSKAPEGLNLVTPDQKYSTSQNAANRLLGFLGIALATPQATPDRPVRE